jgi:peptidoglycan/LPS O-acetylase OafA/YrhL
VKNKINIASLIKFIAAIVVILAHSVNLSTNQKEFMEILTNDTLTLGAISVCIFVTYSGYFTYYSLVNKGDNYFLVRRFKRLFPELLFVVLLCVFLVGPLLTSLKIVDYFKDYHTYLYLINSIFIPYHNLPGVFANNICNSTVNGSLWTLPVEFCCYIAIYIMYKILKKDRFKNNNLLNYISIGISIILIIIIKKLFMDVSFIYLLYFALRLFIVFNISVILARKGCKKWVFIISVIIACVCMCSKNFYLINISYCILLPYIIIYLLRYDISESKVVSFLGDSSYCIYLVAYPIQQVIISINGGYMNWFINFLIASILSITIGCIMTYLFKVLRNKYKLLI